MADVQVLMHQYENDKNTYNENVYIMHHDNPLYAGYEIRILRAEMGHYCVYVRLPANHPDIGKEYDDIDIDVHGDLTYSDNDVFGIDFAHMNDFYPGDPRPNATVWLFNMVNAEAKKMVELFYARA